MNTIGSFPLGPYVSLSHLHRDRVPLRTPELGRLILYIVVGQAILIYAAFQFLAI